LKVRATDLLVKFNVGSAPQTAALSRDRGVKNSADEQRIIADVRPKQERLLGSGARERDQDIGDVLLREMMGLVRNLQPARVRKTFEQGRDIIAKLSIADSALLQNVASEHVEIKLG